MRPPVRVRRLLRPRSKSALGLRSGYIVVDCCACTYALWLTPCALNLDRENVARPSEPPEHIVLKFR
eukprot:scaffold80826_cov78-Phaeocystis_antarctica.AAC.2